MFTSIGRVRRLVSPASRLTAAWAFFLFFGWLMMVVIHEAAVGGSSNGWKLYDLFRRGAGVLYRASSSFFFVKFKW